MPPRRARRSRAWSASGSIDLAIASHTLANIDDLPRLLRQVHRVLKSSSPFVVAMHHPVAAMFDGGDPTARRAVRSRWDHASASCT